jgi:hypothetical protein
MIKRISLGVLLAAAVASAQRWEVGAIGAYAFPPNLTITENRATASAGFQNGGAAGAWGGEDSRRYIGGEARWLYIFQGAKLESGGTAEHFAGNTNVIEGDFLCVLPAGRIAPPALRVLRRGSPGGARHRNGIRLPAAEPFRRAHGDP